MKRRLFPAVLLLAACSDQTVAPSSTPAQTSAQLALHFDSLAGSMSAGNHRIAWLQTIDDAVALGVVPGIIQINVEGTQTVYEAVTIASVIPVAGPGGVTIDSSYVLAAWSGALNPTSFIEATMTFEKKASGDTLRTSVVFYPDTVASALVDSTATVVVKDVVARGLCVKTPLSHLTVPTGGCTKVNVQWSANFPPYISMGIGNVNGVQLTPTQ